MSQAVSPSSGKRYGLARVCRVWRIPLFILNGEREIPNPCTLENEVLAVLKLGATFNGDRRTAKKLLLGRRRLEVAMGKT